MKIILRILSLVVFAVVLWSCEDSVEVNEAELNAELKRGSLGADNTQEPKMVTKPFKAHFYTKRDYSNDGVGYCTEDPYLGFNYQVGEGEATHLGHITTVIQFCGAGLDYKNGDGVFVAANGDELYFNVPSVDSIGHVVLFDDPFYEAYFKDPFEFTGGTGRFKDASGGGMTNSLVDLYDDEDEYIPEHRTDHVWTGTLTLPKK